MGIEGAEHNLRVIAPTDGYTCIFKEWHYAYEPGHVISNNVAFLQKMYKCRLRREPVQHPFKLRNSKCSHTIVGHDTYAIH